MNTTFKSATEAASPTEWELASVETIAAGTKNAIVGGPFGSDLISRDYVRDGVPVIRGQNMGAKYLSGPFAFVSSDKAKTLAANLAHPGDIVFTQRGTVGQVSLVPEYPYRQYLISQSQMKLSVNPKRVDPHFVYYVFSADRHQRMIRNEIIQTGIPHINLGILRRLPIALPSLSEQQTIAEALSDGDTFVESVEQLIVKKRIIKRGAAQALLSGRKRLSGFSLEWEGVVLEDIASFHKGRGLSKAALVTDAGEACIHYGELFTQYRETISVVTKGTREVRRPFRSEINDVLMPTSDVTPRGLATASCIAREGVILGGDILIIRPNANLLYGPFLSYMIREQKQQVLQLVSGTTVFHLYASDMARFAFALPSMEEQMAIVSVLEDLSDEIEALETKLVKAKAIKNGMIQELLTGKTRLV